MTGVDQEKERLVASRDAEISVNPYQAPQGGVPSRGRTHPILWLALFGLCVKVTALWIFFFPEHGIAIAYDLVAITYLVAAYAGVKVPVRRTLRRPNAVEVIVIIAIGCILHGLCMPAVRT